MSTRQPNLIQRLRQRSLGLASSGSVPMRAQGFDQPLFWVTVALLLWGLVMVYSASIAMPENPRFANYTHTYFLIRHIMWLLISFVGALLAYQVPLSVWEKMARPLFLISIALLVLVLV